ncbi:terpene synthase 10-like isoform X1 [Iris pallida]|uniref:Terpene synthase 10-like isoform X1 n=1 Tax=Iris pallida TaxID=29817 RepID=A0AAX6GC77_IRIPA|nr:terpene synthase 10-like isoform X1 [Iris pallida]
MFSFCVPVMPSFQLIKTRVVTGPTNTSAKSCTSHKHAIVRRSANYKPNQWDLASIQTLKSDYTEEAYGSLATKLKEEVRLLFDRIEPLAQVRLIHTVKRLGLGYHFEKEINGLLNAMLSSGYHNMVQKNGLEDTAVLFMLLRQHGFMVSEEIFNDFKDDNGCFAESLSQDVKGLLGLYQASYLSFNGDKTLDEAREFAVRHLKVLDSPTSTLAREVSHALDLPSHWSLQRLQVRRYIDMYKIEEGMNSTLLSLAKLDFNMVQHIHQRELINNICWWKSLRHGKSLSFARDRILECFFVAVSVIFQPQFKSCLEWLPKICALIVILDDIYDVHGSFGELEILTGIIDRWETKEIENLPEYMKICFSTICNTVNEIANNIKQDDRSEIVCRLKKMWADLCKSFLREAKWHHTKYMPTFTEYLNNGWISASGPLILSHVEVLSCQEQRKGSLDLLESCQRLVKLSSTVFRLCNDLATSSAELERGDTPTSIQCYMREVGVSEIDAREHISIVILQTWKEMNREFVSCSSHPRPFTDACVNLARMAVSIYNKGDGLGIPDHEMKDYILSLLMKPVSLTEDELILV